MTLKTVWKHVVTLTMIVLLIAGCSASYHGETVNPASPVADINLPDQDGNTFQLRALHGKVVLVFFGFLNCTEECPLTMANLSRAMTILGDRSKDVQVVLVTTDPIRDTPKAMKAYLEKFNPTFLGITGALDQLIPIWDDWGVVVLDGGETHSSYTYVVDQNGDLVLKFNPEMTPDDIASDLEKLLSKQ